MIRSLMRVVMMVAGNALGLIAAATALDDMSLAVRGFLIAVGVFSAVQLLIQPALTLLGMDRVTALAGSSALVSTLVALVVTDVVSDGLRIHGLGTWVLAAVIVWVVALIGGLLLPIVVFKRWTDHARDERHQEVHTWR